MDRFREFFDAALQRARQESQGQPGSVPSVPSSPLPVMTPGDTWAGDGMAGWGSAPTGLFNLPSMPSPTWSLGGMSGWGSAMPGISSFPPTTSMPAFGADAGWLTPYQTSPLSLAAARKRGVSGGASAVAAPGSPPTANAPLPAHSGPAPVGTRDTVLRWLPQVSQVAQQYNIPPELVLAIMHNESGGDPKAQSPYNPGQGYARGLLQVMPFHFKPGEDPFDVTTNLDKGVKFMAAMYHKYGRDPDKTMAAYFGGPGAIDAAGNIRRGLSDVNISVGNYIDKKFRPTYAAYSNYLRGLSTSGLRERPAQAAPQAANGPADLADLWSWLGGNRTPITGRFGAQDGPYPGTGHRGMDIGTPAGMKLTSPIEGTVIAAGDAGGGYGNQVRIATPYGSVLLGHLASVAVRPGQKVSAGTYLGATGNTGKSTGPHLHFELRDQRDNPIDPARYYRW